MDFGDILKKWEQGQGRTSEQTEFAQQKQRENSSKSNPASSMETWLDGHEVYDKDADTQKEKIPGEKRRRLLNMPPDDIIDIHGFTSENALLALDRFFNNAKSNDYKKLRIIHGKGNHSQGDSILKNTVRKFIEQCGFAGESGFEKAVNGGSGATWVLLK